MNHGTFFFYQQHIGSHLLCRYFPGPKSTCGRTFSPQFYIGRSLLLSASSFQGLSSFSGFGIEMMNDCLLIYEVATYRVI